MTNDEVILAIGAYLLQTQLVTLGTSGEITFVERKDGAFRPSEQLFDDE